MPAESVDKILKTINENKQKIEKEKKEKERKAKLQELFKHGCPTSISGMIAYSHIMNNNNTKIILILLWIGVLKLSIAVYLEN